MNPLKTIFSKQLYSEITDNNIEITFFALFNISCPTFRICGNLEPVWIYGHKLVKSLPLLIERSYSE